MELYDYFKFAAALVFVLCLMGGLSYILKRFNLGQGSMISPADKRLKIVEVLPLDARRKAMLIQRDDTEHLVIFNASGETVIETNIKAPAATKKKGKNEE
ncbi:MAG: FliO/MopB family protein [Alphaproteobacteria bacterium]|nr:FliO/MopB family protein [Alphaproteobacteria bacterium]